MSEQRRLAAILVADVAGFSRLVGADESGTLAKLAALRREIVDPGVARHSGRLFKATGDGFLVEFASAVQAVTCALEIQKTAGPDALPLRIGIHVGDVVVEGDDLMGDGVNIAARIEGIAEPGGIAVSRAVHEQVRDRIAVAFVDRGEVELKNIGRPVHIFAIGGERALAAPALALPDRPSIAVLPFQNMSGDPEQEYFADGLVEDLITALSRFKSLFVIARNSSFSYKGQSPDIRRVGHELGVRYVLEGSIRVSAGRIRVTAQLIETSLGKHVWAQRYDRVLADIFSVQEQITESIVGAMAPEIEASEAARVRRPVNLTAYELAIRANARAFDGSIKNDPALLDQAISDAKAALAVDGGSTIALNALSYAQWSHLMQQTAKDNSAAWREGVEASSKAIEVDRADSRGYSTKGAMLIWATDKDRIDEALVNLRIAYELNPYSVPTLVSLALGEMAAGNSVKVFEYVNHARRISPRDPQTSYFAVLLSAASLCTSEYAAGVEHARRGIAEAPEQGLNHAYLAANLVGLGELSAARDAFADAYRLGPGFVERGLAGKLKFRKTEHLRRVTIFLRVAAGLEDQSAAEALR